MFTSCLKASDFNEFRNSKCNYHNNIQEYFSTTGYWVYISILKNLPWSGILASLKANSQSSYIVKVPYWSVLLYSSLFSPTITTKWFTPYRCEKSSCILKKTSTMKYINTKMQHNILKKSSMYENEPLIW